MPSESPIVATKMWRYTLIITLLIAFLFLRDYLMIVALAGLTTYLLSPIYNRLFKWTKRVSISVFFTMLLAFLLILIPIGGVLGVTVAETRSIVSDIQDPEFRGNISSATNSLSHVFEYANDALERVNINYTVDRESIIKKLQEQLPKALSAAVNFLSTTAGSVPQFFTLLILYLFLLGSMLANKEKLLRAIKDLSPFSERIDDIYIRKVGLMTSAMVRGQLIIAVCQGLIGGLSLWIAGLDHILFFTVLLIFMSFIPLGGGIITLPIAAILLATGNIWQGLVVALVHFVIVTNIDSLLRAKLVDKEAYLPGSLMLLSTFAGVGFFGLIGVIYGPIIMILIVTTLSLYAEEKKRISRQSKSAQH